VSSLSNTQIIQTERVSFTNVAGIIFKDNSGNCWTYQGRFESDYIAPQTVISVTYQGNYFIGVSSIVYQTCQDCITVTSSVTSVIGYMEPCIGGTIDDHMGAYVNLNTPVNVNTRFSVTVYFQNGNSGISCQSTLSNNSSTSFDIFIVAGQSFGTTIACENGQYFQQGATICGACINSCDNPLVSLGSFSC